MEPKDYINHSGGAQGADLTWDSIGREFGVTNHKHWRPSDLLTLTPSEMQEISVAVVDAAIALGRPHSFRGIEYVQRNWFQVKNSQDILAVSRIIEPLDIDKGFVNRTGKQIVSGGTGWAVEMAIQAGGLSRSIHVFDMNTNMWNRWYPSTGMFYVCDIPTLTKSFAGIGSRELTLEGIKAIRDVYTKTFSNGKEE